MSVFGSHSHICNFKNERIEYVVYKNDSPWTEETKNQNRTSCALTYTYKVCNKSNKGFDLKCDHAKSWTEVTNNKLIHISNKKIKSCESKQKKLLKKIKKLGFICEFSGIG